MVTLGTKQSCHHKKPFKSKFMLHYTSIRINKCNVDSCIGFGYFDWFDFNDIFDLGKIILG